MRLFEWIQQFFSPAESAEGVAAPPVQETLELPAVLADIEPDLAGPEEPPGVSGALDVGWLTDVGKVRGHNEDGLFVFIAEQQSNEPLPTFGLFVLADGMGGHHAGEVASATASRVASNHLLSQVYLPMLSGSDRNAMQPSLNEVMTAALSAANREVSVTLPGSGTTLTCALVLGSRLFIGHVGDSRAYLRHANGEIEILTKDHSVVSKLVEIGQLTPEEASTHPQRNMLYRAVGQGTALDVDVASFPLETGDLVFMCSDGLWGLLPDDAIWEIIDAAPTLNQACIDLVAAANAAGGNDNITVIVFSVQRELL